MNGDCEVFKGSWLYFLKFVPRAADYKHYEQGMDQHHQIGWQIYLLK
jgi:hypothetical protein